MDSMSEIFQLDKSNFPAREVIKVIGVGGAATTRSTTSYAVE